MALGSLFLWGWKGQAILGFLWSIRVGWSQLRMGVGQKKPWLGAYNPLHLSACCVTLGKSLSLSKMLVAS